MGIFFVALSLCAVSLAIFSANKKCQFLAILFILAAPTSNAFSQVISYQGIYFYDFFILGYFFRRLIGMSRDRKLMISANQGQALGFFIYATILLVSLSASGLDKYFLKDLRPLINIFFFWVIFDILRGDAFVCSEKGIDRLSLAAAIFAFLKFGILNTGIYGYQDEYYEANSFRYLDAATYFCALYIIYVSCILKRLDLFRYLSLTLSLLCVLLGNSRFMLAALIIAIVAVNIKSLKSGLVAVAGAVLLTLSFYQISVFLDISRVVDNLDYIKIMGQLAVRFGPALEVMNSFSWHNYLVGEGAGTTFYIPWFAYRGLEEVHSNIDSAYLTYFVKYGLISIIPLWLFVNASIPASAARTAFLIFLLAMFLVSATPYQPYCVGFVMAIVLGRRQQWLQK